MPGFFGQYAGIGDANWWGHTSHKIAGVSVTHGSRNDIPKGPLGGNLPVTAYVKYTYKIETQAGADEWNRKKRGGAPRVGVGQTVTFESETHYAMNTAYSQDWIDGRDAQGSPRSKPTPPPPPRTIEQQIEATTKWVQANPGKNAGPAPGY